MRPTSRIKPLLKKIEAIWIKHPDLRLLQILLNLTEDDVAYYMEDDELSRRLDELYNNIKMIPADKVVLRRAEKSLNRPDSVKKNKDYISL
jgi:uncharacterized protein YihD (DUF1040 family)